SGACCITGACPSAGVAQPKASNSPVRKHFRKLVYRRAIELRGKQDKDTLIDSTVIVKGRRGNSALFARAAAIAVAGNATDSSGKYDVIATKRDFGFA
ncbi:MAG: hypothetical protein K8U03_23230, partial [Planctomycetia bacterium]|nr:hypothetical protein [Planctomycetia bacterium]